MARKFFRRFLPDAASVRNNRHVARLGPWLHHPNLWHLNRRSVAGGFAVGLFSGLVPGSNPVQFTAAALPAVGLHVNLPIAVLVTLYSNPLTIVPLYFVAFKLGQLVLLQGGEPPPGPAFEGQAFEQWLAVAADWLMTVGKPLLIGVPLLAVLLAAAGYLLADYAWRLHVRCEWALRCRSRARRSR